MSDLKKKVDFAIKLLRTAEEEAKKRPTNRGGQLTDYVEISYSCGKDSECILHLAQIAGIKHKPIYKATGIDPSGSIAHARSVDAEVIFPKTSFFKLIEKSGFPTRRARFCCQHLKEYKVCEVAVQGIRREESRARAERYHEPQICRVYGSKKRTVEVFLPILNWSDSDVKEFIQSEGIKCHTMYYDENGEFRVERRLGCICCPLQSTKKLREDFKAHPGFVKAYIKHGLVWWNNNPDTRSHRKFGDSLYDLFFHNVFCNTYHDYLMKTNGLFGKMDCKAFLEDYFGINLP